MHNWHFTNDTANKYGWILSSSKEAIANVCSQQSWCPEMIAANTLTLDIEVSEKTPMIQIFYLKSHQDNMGSVKVWLDQREDEHVVLNSKWDLPYSVTKMITIAKENLHGVSSLARGDSFEFPSLTGGKHQLHIAIQEFPKEKGFKWKLIGVSTC